MDQGRNLRLENASESRASAVFNEYMEKEIIPAAPASSHSCQPGTQRVCSLPLPEILQMLLKVICHQRICYK